MLLLLLLRRTLTLLHYLTVFRVGVGGESNLTLTLLFEMATKGQFKPQIGNENKSAEIGGHFTIDKTVQNAIL